MSGKSGLEIALRRLSEARRRLGAQRVVFTWPRSLLRKKGTGEVISHGDLDRLKPRLKDGALVDEDGDAVAVYILKTFASKRNLESEPLGPLYTSVPRYHFTDCATLEAMRRTPFAETGGNRFEARYVKIAKHRDGDLFRCIPKPAFGDWDGGDSVFVRLLPCRHCMQRMGYLWCLPHEKAERVLSFSLEEYFRRFGKDAGPSSLPGNTPDDPDGVPDPPNYSPEWPHIARAAKVGTEWKCECCGVDCSSLEGKAGVHTHHKNKDRSDDSPENLEVLCFLCHRQRHRHLSFGAEHEDAIRGLRIDQGRPPFCISCGA